MSQRAEPIYYVAMTEANLRLAISNLQKYNRAFYRKAMGERARTESTTKPKCDNYVDIKSRVDAQGNHWYYVARMDPEEDFYRNLAIRQPKSEERTPVNVDTLFSPDAIARTFGSQFSLAPQQPQTYQQSPLPSPQQQIPQQTYQQPQAQQTYPSLNCETSVNPYQQQNGVPQQQAQSPFSASVVQGYPQQ